MTDPVINRPNNPWYAKVNNVRVPKVAESKKYLDNAYTMAGGEPPPEEEEE